MLWMPLREVSRRARPSRPARRVAVVTAFCAIAAVAGPLAAQDPPGFYLENGSENRTALGGGPGFVLLDQAPDGNCAQVSDAEASFSHADNFVLPVSLPFPIDHLVFTGAYLFDNMVPPLGSDRFTVRLLGDVAGLPGDLLCEVNKVIPNSRIDTGRDIGSFDLFEFVLRLDWSCQPVLGTYWIEIFEETFVDDEFSWECGGIDPISGIPGAAFATETPGMVWTGEPFNNAILLSAGGIFSDGFESGDTSAWSATVP